MRRCAALLAALAVALAACAGGDERASLPCPKVDVLEYADQLTRFLPGPGRDITDTVFHARILDVRGECRLKEGSAGLRLAIDFAVERGPASPGRKAGFAYFVAIPQFHPAPQGKRLFDMAVQFAEGSSRAVARDDIEVEIPLPKGATGSDYNVFLGFQLSPEELAFNRRRDRR